MTIIDAIKSGKRFEIPLSAYKSDGKEAAIVDEDDFWFLRRFKWSLCNGYAQLKWGKIKLYMHRLILMPSEGFEVDHINRNRLDNRKINLRVCSGADNRRNIGKRIITDSQSRFKGIQKSGKTWMAKIMINKRSIYLGRFESEFEAAKAYDVAALKHHGNFAGLNFPITDYKELGFDD